MLAIAFKKFFALEPILKNFPDSINHEFTKGIKDDPHAEKFNSGDTALILAMNSGKEDLIKMLADRGAKLSSDVLKQIDPVKHSKLLFLLIEGAKVSQDKEYVKQLEGLKKEFNPSDLKAVNVLPKKHWYQFWTETKPYASEGDAKKTPKPEPPKSKV